jgi:hypothetical protein
MRMLYRFAFLAVVVLLNATSALAQTATYNLGPNLGTIAYSYDQSEGTCSFYSGSILVNNNYWIVTYSSIYYENSLVTPAIKQSLPSFTVIVASPGPGIGTDDNCPANTPTSPPPMTYDGSGYTIQLNEGDIPSSSPLTAYIYVTGYINPKYVVAGIIYAPPPGLVSGGVSKGNVSYTDSDLVSSTITTKKSFAASSSYSESSVVSLGVNISGWAGGTQSGGSTSSYTQSTTTTDSTAVTVQKTSGTTLGVNGPECSYVGVDHDYDIIQVWLNPVRIYTLTNYGASAGGSVIEPNGYGYSTLDQPGTDVYGVYAGELNGDLPVRSSTTMAFGRAWASSENWLEGQGPALTAQDQQNILKMDPYWDCTYESPWTNTGTAACAKPPSPTRFTESGGDQNFPYTQPEVGDSPSFQTYTLSYTNTDTQGTDVTATESQTFGIENAFNGKVFGLGFTKTLTQSWTTTETYETSSQFTTSNTTTATATIWQPPCNVVDGVCSPVYPPANAYNPVTCAAITTLPSAFGQGDEFYIYQDNLFGTFLMEPYLEGQ